MGDSPTTSRVIGDFPCLAGTFLISCSLLAFEVSTIRAINFAIGPSYIFIAIALAMLGLTAAGSALSLFDLTSSRRTRDRVLGLLCIAIAVLLVLSHVALAASKDTLNAVIREAGIAEGLSGVVGTLFLNGPLHALKIGLILSLPYFLFGALLSYLFATSKPTEYARLYAADLIGAALGCVAIVITMETTSYAFSVTAPAVCALVAAVVFLLPAGRVWTVPAGLAALVLILLPQTAPFGRLIEPSADPNYLVRDYRANETMAERWIGWNSFTRVAAVERTNAPGDGAVLSLANGDGMAFLLPYDPASATQPLHQPAIPALIAGTPDSALVVFAGVGADMMSLHARGATRLVGLELNEQLVEAGLALPDYQLAEFLALDGVDLRVTEARTFLERDKNLYDMVLVSWSGATAVYHLGTLGGTTQHLFTFEGLSAILDRLNDNGTAVILQVNKFDMLDGLRRYMAERGLPDPARAAIVLYHEDMNNAWDGTWEDNPLLIRLSGWTDTQVEEVRLRAAEHGFRIAYAPGLPSPPQYTAYGDLLKAEDPAAVVRQVSDQFDKRFGISPDDRPFVLEHFRPARFFTSGFWSPDPSASGFDFADISLRVRVEFTLAISAIAFLLAFAPLLISRRKLVSRRRSSVYLAYFFLLGAGFMFVEIGLIHRIGILFGNPGVTIAIVLGLIILSTGFGSLLSEANFRRGMTIRRAALLVVVCTLIVNFFGPLLIEAVMPASFAIKLLATALLILPGGYLMGQLFPQGLTLAGAEDKMLVPWAWAINGAMSTSIAGIAPIVAQSTGFSSLFAIGALLYALLLLLPMESGAPPISARSKHIEET